mmetsp:Transcript_9758/g.22788  ORF Transcript_9758/g.22788 Transcript_9758/m.22788 type:complete len:391 (-) Transcript_9758:300-1472(-)
MALLAKSPPGFSHFKHLEPVVAHGGSEDKSGSVKGLWGGVGEDELRKLATEALKGMGDQVSAGMMKSPSTLILENYNEQPLHVRSRAEQWELARSEITLGEKLGEGDGGVIMHADWRGLDAVAKMLKSDNRNSHISSDVQRADLINEISVLSRLRHPNLVMFLGACTIGEPLLILSEHMRGGNLEDFLIRNRKVAGKPWVPPLKLVARWSVELARAICFLHNCSPIVIHRDLKPANLLLNEDGHIKVGDFGLCKVKRGVGKVSGAYKMTGKTGSMRYMAPEVFHDNPNYDEKVDIYGMAMIYWYMAMGERPFDRVPANIVAEQAANASLRPSLDALTARTGPEFSELVEAAWSGNPAKRPTAGQLVDMLEVWGQQIPQGKDKKGKNCTIM